MVVAFIPSIDDPSFRLSLHVHPRFRQIYPLRVFPHALLNDSKLYKPTSHFCHCVFEPLIPSLIIEKDYRVVIPFVESFFQRRQRFDRPIDICVARQHENRCVLPRSAYVWFLATNMERLVKRYPGSWRGTAKSVDVVYRLQ